MLSALFQDKGAKSQAIVNLSYTISLIGFSPNFKQKYIRAAFYLDRTLTSPQPPRAEQDERNGENGKNEAEQQQQQEVLVVGSEDDRKVADILLAAELENEMEAMAEGGDCDEDEDVYADEEGEDGVAGGEGRVDRSHLVGKPKRKRELKAGLLRSWIWLFYNL